MESFNVNRRKRIALVIALAIIGFIAYLLADRYLIHHVEIADVNEFVSSVNEGGPESTQEILSESSSGDSLTSAIIITNDWNYVSDTVSIKIQEYVTGSGRDTVTYFVADVILSNATELGSAFANNQFGRNIIAYTSEIAEDNEAIFAINGDYCGFRTDGIVIRNGFIYRDEPARIGIAFYLDGSVQIYDETLTSAQKLLDAGVWNTLSFGPALIVDSVIADDLDHVEIDTNFGNHSIQGNNPRTGEGIIDDNHYIFIVVDGRSPGYSIGVNLTEFAQIFQELGCTQAYNIDGGGSSTMYFLGRVVNNPLGKNRERGTSDILFVGT